MRNCQVSGADRLFRLKMRPDTPQKNEYILLSDIRGSCLGEVLLFDSWTQFREVLPSFGGHILAERLDMRTGKICVTCGEEEFQLDDVCIRDSRFAADDPELTNTPGIVFSDILTEPPVK